MTLEHDDDIRGDEAKTIVLLKNEGSILPLGNETVLAVFGQAATVALNGFPPSGGFGGSGPADPGTFFGGGGSSYVFPPYLITPYEALNWRTRQTRGQISAYFDNLNHTLQAAFANQQKRTPALLRYGPNVGKGKTG